MLTATIPTVSGSLSIDDLHRRVPSAFAETPWHEVSDRYAYVPTAELITRIANEGFLPVRADQSRSRIPGKSAFTMHSIAFQHRDTLTIDRQKVGSEVFQFRLTNSHDRASAVIIDPAMWRFVCGNGAVVKSNNLGSFAVRHTGDIADQVIEATYQVLSVAPLVAETIDVWKSTMLDRPAQIALATAALELRVDSSDTDRQSRLDPSKLLNVRRTADESGDLWTTFNRIQENVMRGGLRLTTADYTRRKTRPIKSVAEDLRFNRNLWVLTERMATLLN